MHDPGLKPLMEKFQSNKDMAYPDPGNLKDVREFAYAMRADFDAEHGNVPCAEDVEVVVLQTDGLLGEKLIPTGASKGKTLLYMHGGGWMLGSALSHRHLVSRLAKAAGVVAYNMDYPMSPDHVFPSQLNAMLAAYRHLLEDGVPAEGIVVAGDSAGGGLCVALLLAIKAKNWPQPAGAFLISPYLDLTGNSDTLELMRDRDPWVAPEMAALCGEAYANGLPKDNPFISPVFGDLAGLPPILIHVGSEETLLGDSLSFVKAAALAKVDVTLEVYGGLFHAWHLFHPALGVAGIGAIQAAGAWIGQILSSSSTDKVTV